MHSWLVYIFGLICWKSFIWRVFFIVCVFYFGFFFWPDGCSSFRRKVIMLWRASAARKNKTHRMTNTHVIHSQSMERGWLQWNYSADPARARFIRGLPHPQKIIVRTFDPPSFEGVAWVMLLARSRSLTPCTSALKSAFTLSDVQGTAMKDVWKSGDPAYFAPFSTAGFMCRASSRQPPAPTPATHRHSRFHPITVLCQFPLGPWWASQTLYLLFECFHYSPEFNLTLECWKGLKISQTRNIQLSFQCKFLRVTWCPAGAVSGERGLGRVGCGGGGGWGVQTLESWPAAVRHTFSCGAAFEPW